MERNTFAEKFRKSGCVRLLRPRMWNSGSQGPFSLRKIRHQKSRIANLPTNSNLTVCDGRYWTLPKCTWVGNGRPESWRGSVATQ